jgi:hypothetical protein
MTRLPHDTDSDLYDLRLIPLNRIYRDKLASPKIEEVLEARRFILTSYERMPPITDAQALAFTASVQWWEHLTSDLDTDTEAA